MVGRLLRCILILILVSFTVFSYISNTRTMAKVDYFKPPEPDSGDLLLSGIVSKDPGDRQNIDRIQRLRPLKKSILDGNGNSSGSRGKIITFNYPKINAKDAIALVRSRRIEQDQLLNRDKKQKVFSKVILDSKHILGRKSMELLSVETEVPVRTLVRTIYEPGHLDNDIDVGRICPREGLYTKLLVLITSAVHHEAARMAIRQTWMHYGSRRDVGMAFVLGRSTNHTLEEALGREDFMYRDLVRGHFIDSYNNLTLKTISMLEWTDLHCSKAKFVLKTDDDMFINVPKLITLMTTLNANRSIYGRRAENWKPIRNKWSKYHISFAQYGKATFPFFTTGPAYLLTGDIIHALYLQSLDTAFLKLEDVFTTGIVAGILGIRRINVREIANTRTKFEACHIRDRVSIHMVRNNEQFELWKMLLDDTIKCVKM
ncbi:beta-1,3-galactosyltransferase 5 [Drosophila biarmipes]|uniref:beta-1,3-galactosyltransferase 5 n=1 Tax=Drosophila biarmipes TaxID=125945 RepID=UPI0007E7DD43|nr:beta-1,3-galactosyltransferase 5 [Drosophila biarmipes]